jgi:ankyrin repeat protein
VVRLLEQRGASLEVVADGGEYQKNYGGTVLHAAAMHGNADLIRYLISKQLPIEATANSPTIFPLFAAFPDVTPLGVAAHRGRIEAMAALVEAGANANADGGGEWTPVKLAVAGQSADAVAFLMTHGATAPYEADIIDRLNTSEAVKAVLRKHVASAPAKPAASEQPAASGQAPASEQPAASQQPAAN